MSIRCERTVLTSNVIRCAKAKKHVLTAVLFFRPAPRRKIVGVVADFKKKKKKKKFFFDHELTTSLVQVLGSQHSFEAWFDFHSF